LELWLAFLEVGQIGRYFFDLGMAGLQSPQFREQAPGPLVFELVESFLEPLLGARSAFSI
jgi:hypothetical protein